MVRSSASPVVHGNLGRGRSATSCFATKQPFERHDVGNKCGSRPQYTHRAQASSPIKKPAT
jgi:hypothetical protein